MESMEKIPSMVVQIIVEIDDLGPTPWETGRDLPSPFVEKSIIKILIFRTPQPFYSQYIPKHL